jgi:NitT/TauT family transport system permease protein/sulfonate transport system permease protein
MVGFLLGLAAGIFFGFLLGLNHFARKTINPIIEVLRPIPPIAWIPLAILWFGIGNFSAFFIIFIAAFFPIFTNVFFGVKSLPTIYSQVRKNYGLSTMQYFRHIVWPFSTPFLIAGAKTSIGFSWMAVIAAEMISANEGLGYFIEINRVLLRPERVIAAMLIIGLIGYCLHQAIVAIEKRKLKWRAVAYE